MIRWLALVLGVYTPHLVEEALTGMHDDRIIVAAFTPFAKITARHAAYLVFQIMLVVALGMSLLVAAGGRARLFALGLLAIALLCEAHHLVRALVTFSYAPGLLTALPMPIAGAFLMRHVVRYWNVTSNNASSLPNQPVVPRE